MRTLKKLIGSAFKPARPRRAPDPFRKSRPTAKALAAQHGILIEPMRPGFNVWPPEALADTPADPYDGNHYAEDWNDVLERVNSYVTALAVNKTDIDTAMAPHGATPAA